MVDAAGHDRTDADSHVLEEPLMRKPEDTPLPVLNLTAEQLEERRRARQLFDLQQSHM